MDPVECPPETTQHEKQPKPCPGHHVGARSCRLPRQGPSYRGNPRQGPLAAAQDALAGAAGGPPRRGRAWCSARIRWQDGRIRSWRPWTGLAKKAEKHRPTLDAGAGEGRRGGARERGHLHLGLLVPDSAREEGAGRGGRAHLARDKL
jgi:hypothetical protein